ncbi:hypothetical protein [Rhodoglobus aureus]|uniref:Uncharacterized protein n=1 Tax=Rhodoglobus aureus TaxID=191497 RepID=A0ABP4GKS4_9MICO
MRVLIEQTSMLLYVAHERLRARILEGADMAGTTITESAIAALYGAAGRPRESPSIDLWPMGCCSADHDRVQMDFDSGIGRAGRRCPACGLELDAELLATVDSISIAYGCRVHRIAGVDGPFEAEG